MATAPWPEAEAPGILRRGQLREGAVCGTSLREGLSLCLPHTCHRTGLVLSLCLRQGLWPSTKQPGSHVVGKVAGPFCSRNQSWQIPRTQALYGAGGSQVNLVPEPRNYSKPCFWMTLCRLSYFILALIRGGSQDRWHGPHFPHSLNKQLLCA